MKKGFLSSYFEGVACKILSEVEANPNASHQHEFNGVAGLVRLFGTTTKDDPKTFPAIFLFLNDDDPISSEGFLTWYESRGDYYPKNGMGEKRYRSEHRLYFQSTNVSTNASSGDLLVVAKCLNGKVLVIIAEANTTISNQVQWLFGMHPSVNPSFSVREELETAQDRLSFVSRYILEEIGIIVDDDTEESLLDKMLAKFGEGFPETRIFSEFCRSTIPDINCFDDPDAAIMAWMEKEEILFRTMERHLLGERLIKGFVDDDGKAEVEGFLRLSKSVQNTRKSRAGLALENHLEFLFLQHQLYFDRGKITENTSRPDFLFPGQKEYQDNKFLTSRLSVLCVKTTCKDRWRQVLVEADRINQKHLLTLEPGISTNQTNQMQYNKLRLVLPKSLHVSYTTDQQGWLMNIESFIDLVRSKQQGIK